MAWFKVPSMGMKMRIQYCFTWHTIIHHVPSYVMMFCSLNKTVQLQNCFGELLCLGNLLLLLICKLSSHAQVGITKCILLSKKRKKKKAMAI